MSSSPFCQDQVFTQWLVLCNHSTQFIKISFIQITKKNNKKTKQTKNKHPLIYLHLSSLHFMWPGFEKSVFQISDTVELN